MIDVLVVGGGPAGGVQRSGEARAGLEAVVIEQRPGPVDKACGEGLMPGAVRSLEELVGPLTGFPLKGIRYLDDGTRCAEASFSHGPGLGMRRTALHGVLEKAVRDAGVVLVEGRVADVTQDAVQGRTTHPQPRTMTERGLRTTGSVVEIANSLQREAGQRPY